MTNQEAKTELKSAVLSRFVVQTQYSDIPEQMRHKAIRHILDSVGAGIAGAVSKEAEILVRTFDLMGEGTGCATLWGHKRKMTPANAALFNGVCAHAFELDDTGGCDHSGAVVIPAAFAAVQLAASRGRQIQGQEFVTAIVVGYDIARRALESCGAYAPHNKAGFHSTGTCGTFGAAAACARLLGLNEYETQMALGLAGSFSAGLWACIHDGAQSKRLHAGHAAMGGLLSACLAQNGFTGPAKIFEQVWGGFDHTFAKASDSDDPEAWLKDLGVVWKIGRISVKPHASCRSTHSSIDAIDALREEYGFEAKDVESIDIRISKFVHGMCGGFDFNPMPSAQLSIPYSISADLIYGDAMLPNFARAKRNNPAIAQMLARIHFDIDEAMPDLEEPIVKVTLKDGRIVQKQIPIALGAPQNPLTDEKLLAKFRSVVSMVYDKETTEDLIDALMHIDACSDVNLCIAEKLGHKEETLQPFDV